jgi:malonyl-CoA/methylmalonyl-CoA synthetase
MQDRAHANFYSRLESVFAARAERPAVRLPTGEVKLTYGALRAEAARYANALAVLGVMPGDRVTVQIEKSIAGIALYLAVLKSGAVYQPLNTAYTDAEVDYFVADAEPRLIVTSPQRQMAMRELADRRGVAAVVNLGSCGDGSLSDLSARMDDRHETHPCAPDELAGLLYTSGTTGRSKGAMITHGNLQSNAETLVDIWEISPNDVLLHVLPVFHVHGLFVALHTILLAGGELLWFDRFDPDSTIDALSRATVMMGVPTHYTRLLASPRLDAAACRNMRLFISGSAPLLDETHRRFRERTGHAILERYGMTETGMITSNPLGGERVPGTVGFALPGVSVRLGNGEPGVLEVKGPNVFAGYWRMPEKTAEDFTDDGWFITGDVAAIDDEGRVRIVGRAKDVVISGGFNVYPKEVEDALDAVPGIVESAVFGVPHPDLGEAVVAAVKTGPDSPPEQEIIAALAGRLAKFKIPKRVMAEAELPRNAMGKVLKAELRRTYAKLFEGAGAGRAL